MSLTWYNELERIPPGILERFRTDVARRASREHTELSARHRRWKALILEVPIHCPRNPFRPHFCTALTGGPRDRAHGGKHSNSHDKCDKKRQTGDTDAGD